MDSSFIEWINTLLADGEVSGLFEGDDYLALLNSCKEYSSRMMREMDSVILEAALQI